MTDNGINPRFIPIWQYCKENKISKQNVYRWIREQKVDEDNFMKVKITVERIYIDKNYKHQ